VRLRDAQHVRLRVSLRHRGHLLRLRLLRLRCVAVARQHARIRVRVSSLRVSDSAARPFAMLKADSVRMQKIRFMKMKRAYEIFAAPK
jgi:hypothetical protein